MAGSSWKNNPNWKEEAKEKEAKLHELIHDIGVNYTNDPEQIAEMLAFSSKFYHYSPNNIKLIMQQNPGAVYVQSFAAWKKMDAHVKKGEHGAQILVPVTITYLHVAEDEWVQLSFATEEQRLKYNAGLIEAKTKIAFKIGTVFDIAQTDYPKEKYPEIFSMGYKSSEHEAIVNGLIDFCNVMGCPVYTRSTQSIGLRGYYSPTDKIIVLNDLLEDNMRLSTLTHEMGHFLCNHGNRDISSVQMEFEADCVSIIMQSYFNTELTDSRKRHLSDHYSKFTAELRENNPNITQDEIIKELDGVLDDSLKIFKEHIPNIERYVDEAIEKSKYIDDYQSDTALDPAVSYDVIECSEYPLMGDIYTGIETIEEAVMTYESLDETKKQMGPSINLRLSFEGDDHLISMPVLVGKSVDLASVAMFDDAKNYYSVGTEIKKAIDYIKDNTNYNVFGNEELLESFNSASMQHSYAVR